MVKILLVQFDRFGDNLFIVPLIKGIKRKFPGCHVTVLVRDEFKDILRSYKEVDSVEVADWLELPLQMSGMDESEVITRGYRKLKKVIQDLRSRGFNRVYNLNFSKVSTLLTSLLNIPDTIGFTVNSNGDREIKGEWVNYMGCMVKNRRYNPYHIVDVFRNFEPGLPLEGMSGFKIGSEAEEFADRILNDEGIDIDTPIIAIQPGASNRKRIWPAGEFLRLTELLSGIGVKIIVLGNHGEEDITSKISVGNPAVIDLTGKTTFQQLAAILRRCKLLVSNDTGTVHLASAVGVKVAGLYMCHANPVETGPYGEGHVAISPVIDCFPCNWKESCHYDYKCKGYITPDDVCSVVIWMLSPADTNINIGSSINADISIFDKKGFISYVPLFKRGLKAHDIFNLAYKRMWDEALNKPDRPCMPDIDVKLLKEIYEIVDIEDIRKDINDTMSHVMAIESLADKGHQKTEDILGDIFSSNRQDSALIQSWIEELNGINRLIKQAGSESEPVKPIVEFMNMQNVSSLQAENLIYLLRCNREFSILLKLYASRFSRTVSEITNSIFRKDNAVEAENEKMTSIVILTINGLNFVRLCLDSVIKHTDLPYELIVVDNGSEEDVLNYLDSVKEYLGERMVLIKNGENKGFPHGCNQGIKASKGDYIVLLNSDTIVTDGWLSGMMRVAETDRNIGIVGPVTNNTLPGEQMIPRTYSDTEGLSIFAKDLREKNRGKFTVLEEPAILTGFCMLIKSELVNNIGLIDVDFGLGTFEDNDYCWRARLAGYKLVVAQDVFIHHRLMGSFDANRIDIDKMSRQNLIYFNNKKTINGYREVEVKLDKQENAYHDGDTSISSIALRTLSEGQRREYLFNITYTGSSGQGVIELKLKDTRRDSFNEIMEKELNSALNDRVKTLDMKMFNLCKKAVIDAMELKLVKFPVPERVTFLTNYK